MSKRAAQVIVRPYLSTINDDSDKSTVLPYWRGGTAGHSKAKKGPRHQCKKKRKKN